MKKRIVGQNADHPSVTVSLHDLGLVFHEKRMLDEAEKHHKIAYEMNIRIYGENATHPNIASSSHHRGIISE